MTNEELKEIFGENLHVVNINPGRIVLCDLCNDDFTNSEETGGMLFCSKAVCPHCLPDFKKSVEKYHEEKYIKAKANEEETFRDFVYRLRRGEY